MKKLQFLLMTIILINYQTIEPMEEIIAPRYATNTKPTLHQTLTHIPLAEAFPIVESTSLQPNTIFNKKISQTQPVIATPFDASHHELNLHDAGIAMPITSAKKYPLTFIASQPVVAEPIIENNKTITLNSTSPEFVHDKQGNIIQKIETDTQSNQNTTYYNQDAIIKQTQISPNGTTTHTYYAGNDNGISMTDDQPGEIAAGVDFNGIEIPVQPKISIVSKTVILDPQHKKQQEIANKTDGSKTVKNYNNNQQLESVEHVASNHSKVTDIYQNKEIIRKEFYKPGSLKKDSEVALDLAGNQINREFTYNAANNLTFMKETLHNGTTIKTQYDTQGNIKSSLETYPNKTKKYTKYTAGKESKIIIYAASQKSHMIDFLPNGIKFQTDYDLTDPNNKRIQTTVKIQPDGTKFHTDYDLTDPENKRVTRTIQTQPDGSTFDTAYDPNKRVTRTIQILPDGSQFHTIYDLNDPANKRIQTTVTIQPDKTKFQTDYDLTDPNNKRIQETIQTQPDGSKFHTIYDLNDPANKRIQTTVTIQPDKTKFQTDYDLTDPNNKRIQETVNITPDGTQFHTFYDLTDPNNKRIQETIQTQPDGSKFHTIYDLTEATNKRIQFTVNITPDGRKIVNKLDKNMEKTNIIEYHQDIAKNYKKPHRVGLGSFDTYNVLKDKINKKPSLASDQDID